MSSTGLTKGHATWTSVPLQRQHSNDLSELGGNPQNFPHGADILYPWIPEKDKYLALKKILHKLRMQYNCRQIQIGMNVEKVGGCTKDEIIDRADPPVPLTDLGLITAVPKWFEFTVSASDFNVGSGGSHSVDVGTLPAGTVVHHTKVKHSAIFDTAIPSYTAATLSVGVAGAVSRFLRGFDVLQATGGLVLKDSITGRNTSHAATTALLVTLAVTGGDVGDVGTGVAKVWVLLSKVI